VPANIRVLLRRCLNKDPQRRLQHIGDAAIEISETLNLPASAPPDTTPSDAVSVPPNSWRRPATVVLLALVAIAAALAAWHLKPSARPGKPARRFTVYPETTFEVEALWHHAMALSPDGKNLAYVEQGSDGRRKIYVRQLDEFEAAPLVGTEGAISPFFSPDGEWIGYADHFQRNIEKIPAKGGVPIILAESMNFRGASWAPDDTIIYAPTATTGLWHISASGEGAEQLTVPDANAGETGHGWPQILPDQEHVLFTNFRSGGPDEYRIETYSLPTQERCVLFKGGSCARYVPTGHVVYGRDETLYAVKFDLDRLKVTGPHVPVVPGVVTPPSFSAQFAVSNDGTLAYVPVQAHRTELMPVWVDRQGKVEPVPGAMPRNYNNARISSDGSRIAFGIQDGADRDIWIYDVNRTTLSPLTSDGTDRASPETSQNCLQRFREPPGFLCPSRTTAPSCWSPGRTRTIRSGTMTCGWPHWPPRTECPGPSSREITIKDTASGPPTVSGSHTPRMNRAGGRYTSSPIPVLAPRPWYRPRAVTSLCGHGTERNCSTAAATE